ncbi:hypothetical protein ACWGJ9_11515 [Curtobacterium citreum]
MSHFNPISAGEAALGRGDEGIGILSGEVDLLQRAFHDLDAPADLMGDLGRFREDVRKLNTEWERLKAEAKALFAEKGPRQKWD